MKKSTILFVGDEALMDPFANELRKKDYFVKHIKYDSDIEKGIKIKPSIAIIQWVHKKNKKKRIGTTALHKLRAKSAKLPTIAICDQGSEKARIAALNEGADDAVERKNCSANELNARIERILRRADSKNANHIALGEIVIEHDKRRVFRNNRAIELCPAEYEILRLLVATPDRVFSREALARHLGKNFQEKTIDVYIGRLRKALGDKQRTIKTKIGAGYYACAPNS